jgi:WD40 repeat protein
MPNVETESDMVLEIYKLRSVTPVIQPFQFHSAIALSSDRHTLYTCIAISDNDVTCYKRGKVRWRYIDTLSGNNTDPVFALTLSTDDHWLVATLAAGHKVWSLLDTAQPRYLRLPEGVRNIPGKTCLPRGGGLVATTGNGRYVVSAVRQNLYVWELNTACLVKTLDAHFGRIMALQSITGSDNCCHVVSASIDKSIKVTSLAILFIIGPTVGQNIRSVLSCLCLSLGPLLCPQIPDDFDQTWYGGSEPQMRGRVRVWYKSENKLRFYAGILNFDLLHQYCCHSYVES